MAKQKKIHELAKELGIASRLIVDYMNKKGNERQKTYTASNLLLEEDEADIRKNLKIRDIAGNTAKNASSAKAGNPGKAEDAAKAENPRKADGAVKTVSHSKAENPAKAENAGKADSPAKAENAGKPENAGKAESPVKTGNANKPESAAKAENQAKPAKQRQGEVKGQRPKAKPAAKSDAKAAAKEGGKENAKEGEARPKKKSSITAVFNAQYSKQGRRKPKNKQAGERGQRNGKPQAERPHVPIRPNADRPNYDRASAHVPDDEIVKPQEKPMEKSAEKSIEKPQRPQEKPTSGAGQSQDKTAAAKNTQSMEKHASVGSQSVGHAKILGNVFSRSNANAKNGAPERSRNDRGGKNGGFEQKGEKGRSKNRANTGNNFGDKGGGKVNPNRQKEFKGRQDSEVNRFRKDATKSVPDEYRKESRDARDRDNGRKKNNNTRDYDKLGGKKQERYVNLEKTSGHKKKAPAPAPAAKEEVIRSITLPEHMTIRELADKMKVQPSIIVKKLFLKGTMVTVNQDIDYEHAEEIALEFNCIAEPEEKIDVIAELLKEGEEDESKMTSRPPVVCVMGHVDHGKTSLLDAIRNTRVTDKEAGGITQAIGAYTVKCNGENITFLDTPGHEAFTAMRMRGANSTDIAILVVAADDGVMPQTIEAINHAKAAGIEIIVAVNKIDKPNANVERVKQELSEYELIPEDWGGSTIFVPVSAHTHEGIEQLLEMILLTAEVLELKANPKRNARGVVIEAKLDKGRGAVATVLVQKGTLKVGQPIACGSSFGKVRAMIDDKGRNVKEAKPSMPVEILGLSNVPDAGETFVVCESEKEARSFAQTYISASKEKLLEDTRSRMSLDDLFSQIQSGNVKELNIIVKADVQGSVEAVKQSLVKLSNEEVVVKIIHGGVGSVNESDVNLASASNAIIIGFNVRPDPVAKTTAEREGVDIRLYKVIYDAIEDVSSAMKGMLDPVFEEKIIGHAEVRQIFKASGVGNIAGSYVLDGTFERGCKCRVTREGEQLFDGNLASLKRFKDDVKEVRAGYECGLVFEGFNDIAEFDQIEAYKMVEVPRS